MPIAAPPGYTAVPGQPWNVNPTPPAAPTAPVSPYAGTPAERAARMRQSSAPSTLPAYTGNDPSQMIAYQAAQMQQNAQQYNAWLAGQGGGAGGAGGDPNVANARNQMFGLATGNMNRLENNPVDTEVLNMLQQRAHNGPYNAETIQALQTGAAETQGQETRNAMAQLARSGLSPSDPAYQSRVNEIQAAQGAAAQQANLGIQQNANIQNYNAAGTAIGQYGGYNTNRNLNINQASNYLGGLYGQVFAPINGRPAEQANYTMPSQQQYQQQMGGGSAGGYDDPYGHTPSPTYAPGSPSAPTGRTSYTAPANNPYVNNPEAAQQGGIEQTQAGGSEAANAYINNTGGASIVAGDRQNPQDKYLSSYLQRTSKPVKTQAMSGYSNQAS